MVSDTARSDALVADLGTKGDASGVFSISSLQRKVSNLNQTVETLSGREAKIEEAKEAVIRAQEEKKAMLQNACDVLSMRAKEIEDLLSSVPDPTADESNFSLHMRKKGCTPQDFVAQRTSWTMAFRTSTNYSMPCSFRKKSRVRMQRPWTNAKRCQNTQMML